MKKENPLPTQKEKVEGENMMVDRMKFQGNKVERFKGMKKEKMKI